jgi:uncharacterized membrane protein YjjP (DUF1212 family)
MTGVNADAALRFATRAGAMLLSSGAAASDVVEVTWSIASKAGLDVTADVTYTHLTISYLRSESQPYLGTEMIRTRTFDYGRLTEVSEVVDGYLNGRITVGEGLARLAAIDAARRDYPWWLTRLGAGFAGAMAAFIFGGDWIVMVGAFVANVFLDYALGILGRHYWPSFFLQVVAGLVAVIVAGTVQAVEPGSDSSRVVIAVIIVMLAGMTYTGAIQDAIAGWYLTSVGRLYEAIMNTFGLIVGIELGVIGAASVGVDLRISPSVSVEAYQVPITIAASALIATAFSFVARIPIRIVAPVTLLSALGYAIYLGALETRIGGVWATAAAAFAIGFIAVLLTKGFRAPAAAFAIASILPLLPGVLLYEGLVNLAHSPANGAAALVDALGTALALAGGLSAGEYAAIVTGRPLRLVGGTAFIPHFRPASGLRNWAEQSPKEK